MEGDQESNAPGIPEDVLLEILLYLPVKSLIRFTAVCKSWLSIIRSRAFAVKHFLSRTTYSSSLMDNVDYIFILPCRSPIPSGENGIVKLSMFSITERKTFRFSKKLECGPGLNVAASYPCHGIICMSVSNYDVKNRFLLCNPAIREVISLPGIPQGCVYCFGFGFDQGRNDYKVVALTSSLRGTCPPVQLYSVLSGCWRTLPASVSSSVDLSNMTGSPTLNANGRFCNWLITKESFVSFDMVLEIFQETSLPDCCPNKHSYELLPSSRWQACLCCYVDTSWYPGADHSIDIWVLEGCSNGCGGGDDNRNFMWTKQLSIKLSDPSVILPLPVWINDEQFLVYRYDVRGIGLMEVLHYEIHSKELKRTGYYYGSFASAKGYVESLVSLKSLISSCKQRNDGNSSKVDDHDLASEQKKQTSHYFLREVYKRYVRWSCCLNLV